MKFAPLLIALCLAFNTICLAQNGKYDVRFKVGEFSCSHSKLFIDIEVRAESPSTTFYISDQNYRFSFNPLALNNPFLVQEHVLSGSVQTTSPPSFSFFSPHTLTGSIDSIVSYNVEMLGGDGYPLNDVDYVKVGRIGFDILDVDGCFSLRFHDNDPTNFPNTTISEWNNKGSFLVEEGSYGHFLHCLLDPCNNDPPIATDDYLSTLQDSVVTQSLVVNDYDAFGNLDFSSLQLLSIPTTSEGYVSLDNTTGLLTFTPDNGFVGNVAPFYYTICDGGTNLPSTQGNSNYGIQSLPIPIDTVYYLQGPKCDTAAIYITVEEFVLEPDLAPVITVIPANLQGLSTLGVAVKITELQGQSTSGTVIVRIPKDPRLVFTWDSNLTFIAFNSVDNVDWNYVANPVFHQFTYPLSLSGFDKTSFGFLATYDPQGTDGQTTITATIVPFTGGDSQPINNVDSEIIIYFN